MPRIITVANNKGGVGKTTTAVSIGAALRNRGYDVLIIDYDGQANATATLRVPTSGGTTYVGMKTPATAKVPPVRVLAPEGSAGVLDVVPSCADVSTLENGLTGQPDRLTRFATFVGRYRDDYDVIIVDTPPALGLLSMSAICAADDLIIAVQPHYLAAKGLLDLNNAITAVRAERLNQYVLFTQYDRRKGLHRLTVEQAEGAGFHVFATKIRDNVALAEAPAAGLDIFRYAPRSNGAADYDAVTDEYLNGRKLRHVKHGNR